MCCDRRLYVQVCAIALLLGVACVSARADDAAESPAPQKKYLPWEKGALSGGGFLATLDGSVSFGLGQGGGIYLDAEDLLGLDSTLTVWRADAMYRPGKTLRHQFDFSYVGLHRTADTVLNQEIKVDDEIILPGTRIHSVFDLDIYRLTYSYAVLQDERMRIAVGLGIYGVPIRYGIEITEPGDDRALEIRNVVLPLPTLAIRSEFQLVPKLFLNLSVNFMYLEVGDFKGSLVDANIGLEYRMWKHFGMGLAYNPLSVHVESESKNADYPGASFVGSADVSYNGLLLYGKLSF